MNLENNKYLALLRGINVGGNNIIKMVDLKKCFEDLGFTGVRTYIQSGNVIFEYEFEREHVKDLGNQNVLFHNLTSTIENQLSSRFNYQSKVVVISKKQLEMVINSAPETFGVSPKVYRYDVMFLMPGLDPDDVLSSISIRDGVDQAWSGDRVIYFSRLIERAGSSYLNKIVSTPIYKNLTIRNWNTTKKLAALMDICV